MITGHQNSRIIKSELKHALLDSNSQKIQSIRPPIYGALENEEEKTHSSTPSHYFSLSSEEYSTSQYRTHNKQILNSNEIHLSNSFKACLCQKKIIFPTIGGALFGTIVSIPTCNTCFIGSCIPASAISFSLTAFMCDKD